MVYLKVQQVSLQGFGDKHCISGVTITIRHKHSHCIIVRQILNLVLQIKHLIVSHLTQDLIIWDSVREQEVLPIIMNYVLGVYNSRNNAYL